MREEFWERGLSPELKTKLRDPEYLPTRDEVLQIKDYNDYSNANGDHEILHQEYIGALANYLEERCQVLWKNDGLRPITIMEVGAGTGRLTHFLEKELEARREAKGLPRIMIIAINKPATVEVPEPSEDGEEPWIVPPIKATARVDAMDANEAIAEYAPDIVIASWPTIDNLSQLVQEQKTVRELIIIGESEACPAMCEEGKYDWKEIPGYTQITHT